MFKELKVLNKITDKREDRLTYYLNEITKFSVLSPDEEFDIACKVSEGDEEAREKLIKHNLRFVVSAAKQYQHRGKLADLIGWGNEGLIKATYLYDPSTGFKFISFAVNWIRSFILIGIKTEERLIRLPQDYYHLLNKMYEVEAKGEDKIYTDEELATIIGTTNTKISLLRKYSHRTQAMSYDLPKFNDGGESKINELQTPQKRNGEGKKIIKKLPFLTDQEKYIILHTYGFSPEKTFEAIGQEYGVSDERIRQIKNRALKKIRQNFSPQEFGNILEG
jgi:RNA polymerase primary sigma factor